MWPGSFILILALCASTVVAQTTPDERLPVPKSLDQIKIDKQLAGKYKTEMASRDASDRLALAKTLRQSASDEKDATARYVMLLRARDQAVSAGDLPLCMSIIDDISKSYAPSAAEMKGSALSLAVDAALVPPTDLFQSYMKVTDEALAEWNLDLAHKAAYLARKVGHGDRTLVAEADARDRTVRIQNAELVKVIQAERKLAKTPDDPQVNLIVGRHLCFNTNHWENGLNYLVKSPLGPLKDLAEKDLAQPADSAAMAALAEEWWNFSDPKNKIASGAGHGRAAYWYAKALPGLAGDQKAVAEKRLAEPTP